MMLFLPSLLALLGGVGSLRIRSRRARNRFLMGAVTAASLAVLLLLMDGSAPDVTLLRIPPCFSLAFRVDPVNRIFLGLVAVLWPLATLYAFEYMTAEEREPRFFAFFLASYAVTVPLALSANLFTLYLGYECLTLIPLPLVTHREDGDSLRAGMVYLEFTVGGAALDSYMADVDTDANFEKDTEVVADGYFHESEFRSAPYFDVQIDGINLLDTAF